MGKNIKRDDNNEPLTDALVRIKSGKFGISDSTRSDEAGKVIFNQIPKCSSVEVIGSKYGWFNDTVSGNTHEIYQKDDTLYLKQEKTIVKFFVKDLYSKKPLVRAKGSLFFNSDPKKAIQIVRTNINGVAKGVFENIHKIKKIRIDVKHQPYYNDSSTIKYYVVENWNKRKNENKIICLRPNPHPILFQNIVSKTKKGISNVENIVTVIKADDSKNPSETLISDRSGSFSISASMGDKITIVARSRSICPYEYLLNNLTIKNTEYGTLKSDANKRKIPLCRKEAPKIIFKNTDIDTGTPVSGVTNVVKVHGGGSYTYKSGSDGTFTISDVYECQIISVSSSKLNYRVNNTKIQRQKYDFLMAGTLNKRTIPLKKLPPMKPCVGGGGEDNSSSGKGYHKERYNMGRPSGKFEFEYFTNIAKDRIKVTCNGIVLMDVTIATNFKWKSRTFTFTDQVVVVEVFGDTDWEYIVNCP